MGYLLNCCDSTRHRGSKGGAIARCVCQQCFAQRAEREPRSFLLHNASLCACVLKTVSAILRYLSKAPDCSYLETTLYLLQSLGIVSVCFIHWIAYCQSVSCTRGIHWIDYCQYSVHLSQSWSIVRVPEIPIAITGLLVVRVCLLSEFQNTQEIKKTFFS